MKQIIQEPLSQESRHSDTAANTGTVERVTQSYVILLKAFQPEV